MSGAIRRNIPGGPSSNGGSIYDGGPGSYASNAGGRSANFDELYKQIRDRNEQASSNAKENEKRDLSGIDYAMAGLSSMGDAIQNFGGFNDAFSKKVEDGGLATDPVGTLLNFAPTLPLGIVGGYPRGIASGYEAVTGHAVRDADMDNMKMSNQDLDPMQRAGSLVNAGIELAGPLVGGSGRMLGGVGNLARRASDKADDLLGKVMPAEGRGLLHRIGKEEGMGELASTAGQFAFDVAEEAGEEFVQSYADDFRFQKIGDDSFSRALEQAGWGALGGGMMSGAGIAMSKAAEIGKTKTDALGEPEMSGQGNPAPWAQADFQTKMVPSAKAYVDENLFDRNVKEPGSFGAVMVPGHWGQDLNTARMGTEDFRAAYRAQDDEGKAIWAKRLGTTADYLSSVIYDNGADLTAKLNALVESVDGGVMTSLVRNPGTSFSSKFSAYLGGFDEGYGMKLNALAYQLSGGDVDGDTRTIRFNEDGDDVRYPLPSELMTTRLSGDVSSMNFEYMPFLDTDEAQGKIDSIVYQRLLGGGLSEDAAATWSRKISKLSRTAYAKRDNEFGKSMTMLLNDLKGMGLDGNRIVSGMVTDMQGVITDSDVAMSVMRDRLVEIDKKTLKAVSDTIIGDKEHWDSGTVAKAKSIAEVAEMLDLVYGSTAAVKSLWYRQTAAMKLEQGKRFPMLKDIMEYMGGYGTDAINNRIAMWMRLYAEGEHVEELISNEFNAFVELRFYQELTNLEQTGTARRIGMMGGLSVSDFEKAFQTAYNDGVDTYDNAIKKTPYSEGPMVVGAIVKNPIDFDKDNRAAMSAMLRTIGTANISEYVAVGEGSMLADLTFDQIVNQLSSSSIDTASFTELGEETQKFMTSLVNAAHDNETRVNNALMENLDNIPRLDPSVALTAEHYNQAVWILDAFFNSVAPEVGMYASIAKVEDSINAGYGEIIFNGTAEQRANLAIVLSLGYKYNEVIDNIGKYKKTGNDKYYDLAVQIANSIRDKSQLSEAIYADLVERRDTRIVETLSDLDISYSDKVEALKTLYSNGGYRNEPLLVTAVRTDKTAMGISGISKRVITMDGSINSAKREDFQRNREDARNFRKRVEAEPNLINRLPVLFKEYCNNSMLKANRKILAGMLADSRIVNLKTAEKGTVTDACSMMYQQIEKRFMGCPVGMIQNLTGWRFGKMSMDEFASNKLAVVDVLFNNGSVTVYNGLDEKTVTCETLYNDLVGGNETVSNGMLSSRQIFKLMESCPQIMNLLCETIMTPTTSKEEGGGIRQSANESVFADISDGFFTWLSEHGSDVGNLERQQEMNNVEWELLATPGYYELVAMSADTESGGNIDLELIRSHKMWVEFFYNAARTGTFDTKDISVYLNQKVFHETMRGLREKLLDSGRLSNMIASDYNPNMQYISDHAVSIDDMAAMVLDGVKFEKAFDSVMEWRNKIEEAVANATNASEKDARQMELQMFDLAAAGITESVNSYKGYFGQLLNGEIAKREYLEATIAMMGEDSYAQSIYESMLYRVGLGNLSQEFAKMLDDVMTDAKVAIKEQISIAMGNSNVITESDLLDWNVLSRKLAKLKLSDRYFTLNEDSFNKVSKNLKELYRSWKSGEIGRSDYLKQANKIRMRTVNTVLRTALHDMGATSGADLNVDMFHDSYRAASEIEKIVDRLKGDPSIVVTQSKPGDPKPPKMNIANPMNTYMASNARLYAQTGQIGTGVGTNGVVLNQLMGIALLPHDRSCNSDGAETITWAKLRSNIPAYLNMYVTVDAPDGAQSFYVCEDTANQSWFDRFSDDQKVTVHNDLCQCGWCKKHSSVAFNGDNSRFVDISDIITTLLDWSQEDANLKLKKSLEASERIVGRYRSAPEFRAASIDIGQSTNLTDAIQQLSSARAAVVRDVASIYDSEFNENDIALDHMHAERLAQFLCSAFKVEDALGNGATRYISLMELNEGSLGGIMSEMPSGAKVTPMICSLDQVNKKIMAEISAERRKGGRLEDATVEKVNEVAWDALTKWSGYGGGKLNVKAAMSTAGVLPRAGRSRMLPADSASALMSFREQQELMGNRTYPQAEPLKIMQNIPEVALSIELKTKSLLKDSYIGFDGNGGVPFAITAIYGDGHIDDGNLRKLKHDVDGYKGDNAIRIPNNDAAVLVMDAKKASGMLKDYHSELYRYDYAIVPKESFGTAGPPMGSEAKNVMIDNSQYVVVRINKIKTVYQEQGERSRYSSTKASIEQFFMCYGDDIGLIQFPDSGSIGDPEGLRMIKRTDDRPVVIDFADNLNSDESPVEIVPRNKFNQMIEDLNDDFAAHISWPSIKKLDKSMLKDMIDDFIADKNHDDFGSDGMRRSKVAMHSIIGFASQVKVDGTRVYYPLVLSGNHPQIVDMLENAKVIGSKVVVQASTEVSFGDGDFRKLAWPGEAYKTVTTFPSDEAMKQDVMIGAPGMLGNMRRVLNYDAKAQQGRLYGRGNQVLKGNLYGASKMLECSARFSLTSEGWVKNPKLNPVLSDDMIDRLFDRTTNDPAWMEIATGRTTLFASQYANANAAVQKLANDAMLNGNGVILSTILEPWQFDMSISDMAKAISAAEESGSPKPTWTSSPRWRPVVHNEILGILRHVSPSEALALFNAIREDICPESARASVVTGKQKTTMVNSDGRILGMWRGEAYYFPGRIGQVTTMNVESETGEGLGAAAFGKQHILKHALENGARPQDIDEIVDAIAANDGDSSMFAGPGGRAYRSAAQRDADFDGTTTWQTEAPTIDILDGPWMNTYAREIMNKQIAAQARTFTSLNVVVTRGTGENKEVYRGPVEMRRLGEFKVAKDTLCSALGAKDISVELMMNLVKCYCGWSFSDGDGSNEISMSQVNAAVKHIASNISSSSRDYILKGGKLDVEENRVCMAMLPKGVAESLWDVASNVRSKFNDDFNAFRASMDSQMVDTWDGIKTIKYISKGSAGKSQEMKKTALKFMAMYIEKTWGKPPSDTEVFAGVDFDDVREAMSTALRALMPDEDQRALDEALRQIDKAKLNARYNSARVNSRRQTRLESKAAAQGYEVIVKDSGYGLGTKVMKSLESTVRLMGISNPFLFPANAIEALGHTAILKAGINMPVGPYSGKRSMSNETVDQISQDDRLLKYYKAYKEAVLLGMDNEFIVGYTNAQDKDDFIDSLYSGRSKFEKLSDRLFTLSSAENLGLRNQLQLSLMRFDQICNANNIVEQLVQNSDGATMMEIKLIDDPVSWLNGVLAANSPSRMAWLQATNWSEGTSMARENAVSLLTRELFERVPLVSFASTTMFTPFYRYVTNYTGRVLNWFMPISAMNYVINETLAQTEIGQQVGIERAQIHTSLKAAVFADAMHMSIPVLVCLLVGMTGCLEPPEDEDKIIDYREWTFFGYRINPEWWIQDCLGPALPMACWVKSAMNGKPRMDILFQGLGTVLQNNPLMRIDDLVNVLVEPDTFAEGWQEEADRYMWAPGGEPTSSEMLLAKASQFGLNCLGKLITPSFLKEWYRDCQKYEKSYKRVFAQGVEDVNAEAGQTGDTERIDYREAMIRQCTRNNPVLGFIMDFTTKPTTSYMAMGNPLLDIQGMPNVEYQDPIQRGIMDRYSVNTKNEKGEYVPKSDAEKQQVALDVLATLEAYDDMEELRSKGFMIDYDTRAYVSEQIWGIIKNANSSFYSWYNSPESDPNVLSPGDYWAGREIRNQAYQENQALVEYWKSVYYDKLWSTPMKMGVQKYFRENTDYRQDANGEWFASGFPRATSLLGIKIAPGTTTDPQDTMGREGDWATPSAVVEGGNTWERALVPIDEEYVDTPDIESWDKDKDGSGNGNGNGNQSSGYNPYGYGGWGGGGGGGGGYRKSIYSKPGSVSMSAPRVSSAPRLDDNRFDYLRPGFETKGSREASRRSDF